MYSHWIKREQPAVVLAPMEGVTDAAFRSLITTYGGFSHCVTEFIRVAQNPVSKRTLLRHVPELPNSAKTESGTPVIVQLLGGNEERILASALNAVELGAKAIDINFGCPSPTVNRNDGGATLLKYPKRIRSILESLRRGLPSEIAVSAKIRLGYDDPSTVYENASMVFESGANWLTIHARTKAQGYSARADWQSIAAINKDAPIPVVANGDIFSLQSFEVCRDITGCDHFMIGRGVFINPFLANVIQARLLGKEYIDPTPDHIFWHKHFAKMFEYGRRFDERDEVILRRVKQWLALRRVKCETPCFEQIKTIQRATEFLGLACNVKNFEMRYL